MRWLPLMMILSLLLAGTAFAAEGVHSKLKMTMTMDMGTEMPEEAAGFGDGMSFDGEMYTAGDRLRFDMNMFGMTSTTIIDSTTNDMWTVVPMTQQVIHSDLGDYGADFMDMEGGMMSPTGMSFDMEEYKAIIDEMEGFTYKELPDATVLGENCKGLEFIIDTEALKQAVTAGELSAEEASTLSGSVSGTVYFSEKYDMPLLMNMQMAEEEMKMSLQWEVTEISFWTPVDSIFAVPEGYTVVEADEMMQQMGSPPNPHGF